MKSYRSLSGPFFERPYYELTEIEQICSDELHKFNLLPSVPEPIRIERFIEKRFKVTPFYEDLPDGVLGYTKFGPKGVHAIGISRALSEREETGSERRVITTMAHEAGHGLLHAHLFAFSELPASLFSNDMILTEPKILCRKETVDGFRENAKISNYRGQWWEFQANQAMGSLLLPRRLAMKTLDPFLMEIGQMGKKLPDPKLKEEAISELVHVFNINPIVARIRMDSIFPNACGPQLPI